MDGYHQYCQLLCRHSRVIRLCQFCWGWSRYQLIPSTISLVLERWQILFQKVDSCSSIDCWWEHSSINLRFEWKSCSPSIFTGLSCLLSAPCIFAYLLLINVEMFSAIVSDLLYSYDQWIISGLEFIGNSSWRRNFSIGCGHLTGNFHFDLLTRTFRRESYDDHRTLFWSILWSDEVKTHGITAYWEISICLSLSFLSSDGNSSISSCRSSFHNEYSHVSDWRWTCTIHYWTGMITDKRSKITLTVLSNPSSM